MKVAINTSITPEVTIYDTQAEGPPSPITNMLTALLNPVVVIRDDSNRVLYTYGEYDPNPILSLVLMGAVIFITFRLLKR